MNYFKRKLDDKNRLTMPVELRGEFASGEVVITPGFGRYLHLYSRLLWDGELQTALQGKWRGTDAKPAIIDEELANLADQLFDGLVETTLDTKQGRVTLDSDLLAYAGIAAGSEVVATRMPGGYWRLKTSKRN